MPFVAASTGYDPILEVHLDTVTVTSSLNDIRLVHADSCRVSAKAINLNIDSQHATFPHSGTRPDANTAGLEWRTDVEVFCLAPSTCPVASAGPRQHVHRFGQGLEFRPSNRLQSFRTHALRAGH